ncbi:MAG: RNA methyltransferase [Bacteroidales bacterium]|jgi:tRNA G18 (ribose-2'-O)-methylase SpoU|nr:RNA methyltransferase [Bacteroidales bacterium]
MNRFQKLEMEELHRKTPEEIRLSEKMPVVVVLDNVRSLHNTGSIFRTCDAFAVTALLLCGISATPPHREIHKAALGAENTVNWRYFPTTMQAVEHLKAEKYALWGIEQTRNSTLLGNFRMEQYVRHAFIFGNEVRGIEQEVINCCEGCIEIPQFGAKHSFNVSVCAGIVLWECYRQLSPMS